MSPNVLPSLRARVLVGVVAAACIVLALFGWRAYTEWDYRLDAARVRVQKNAELLAAEQHGFLDNTSAVITGLLRADEVSAFAPSRMCVKELERAQLESAHFTTIDVALPNGRVVCSALTKGEVANIGDQPAFRRALSTSELVVGDARYDPATRAVTLPLYQAALGASGTARGVIAIGVDLASVTREMTSTTFPEGTRVGIVDASGRILVRTPDPEGLADDNLATAPVFRGIRARGGSGWVEGVSADGVRRIFGFAPLVETDAGPITVWVATPSAVVVKEVTRDFVLPLGVTFVLSLIVFIGAYFESDRLFVRPVLALTNTALRLAAGELTARVRLHEQHSELGRLGRSLNAMAMALQADRQQLERTHQALYRLHEVFERIPAVMAYVDQAMCIQFANRAAADWAGAEPERIAGMSLRALLGEDGFAKAKSHAAAALEGTLQRYSLTFLDAKQVLRDAEIVHVPDRGPQGVGGFFLIANDVTEAKRQQADLDRLAHVDTLTALPNRRAFEAQLAQAHKRAQREGTWLAVLFLDIDDFKTINDTYGHAAGDIVLQTFGAKLKAAVRNVDVVARLGGDEFTVLLEGLRSPSALDRVVAQIEASLATTADIDGHPMILRASIGTAIGLASVTTPDQLLADADARMYQVKHRRRRGETPQTADGSAPTVSGAKPAAESSGPGQRA